jgi:alcohol dehydrogenase
VIITTALVKLRSRRRLMSSFGLSTLRAPGTIRFGEGSVVTVGPTVRALAGDGKVLVCTDPYLAGAAQGAAVESSLREAGLEVEILAGAEPELPLPAVERAIATAREVDPVALVGLGGGSCIDLAKLVALGLVHEGPIDRYYGENAVPGPCAPLVAVPTTGGTGSEVTPVAVVTDPAQSLKVGVSSPWLIPRAAICDPELSLGAPRKVTAYAGIDALAHAIEAYTALPRPSWDDIGQRVAVGSGALTDAFALRAIGEISTSFLDALEDRGSGRAGMLAGSLLAGLAFGTAGVAAAHALQYPVGARTKTPHGLGVGLLLPFVMRFNKPAAGERLAQTGEALGVGSDADAAVARVRELGLEAGLPPSLREIGVNLEDLPPMAAEAIKIARLIDNNPRPVGLADAESLLEACWYGDLELLT